MLNAAFGAIARAGLAWTLDAGNAARLGLGLPSGADPGALDLVGIGQRSAPAVGVRAPPEAQERRIGQLLVNQKVRDAAFRCAVCDVYGDRCAVTGLRIVNGGGRAEAQAAHILPVADGGPDVVRNGLALSATVHWLFDRHLLSLTDDLGLLVSHNKAHSELRALFARHLDRIHLPADRRLWPHPSYVARHRERFASASGPGG